jgi:nucleotide-binding universal stress UspA family protein
MAQRNSDGRVLFAYDGSDLAKNAIREAARQLSPGRQGIVLTVWEPLASHPFAGGTATWGVLEDDFEVAAKKVAEEGARLARSVGFNATPLAQRGSPIWQSIVASAADHAAGIVVMGSHGRSGIGLVLMGSVAAAVARHTERPVLVVHAPPAGETA